ncbi:MAG: nuclear transport factor 2 family protein [Actinomycetota bacterium]
MAQDNVDVVQGAWDAFGRGDIDAVLEAIAPSAETRLPESLPWGGTYAGPDGFRDFLTKLGDSWDQFSATPQKVLGADDNHVVVLAKTKGRTKAGATIEGRTIWIYQLRDGKIADAESFGDTAQLLEALA